MKFSSLSPRPPARKHIDLKTKLAMARLRMAKHVAQADESADPVWKPDPDNKPQMAAYYSDADVVGYGGRAGGGKTDLLVGLASTAHIKSIIFRRESTTLKDVVSRAKELTEGRRLGFNGTSGMLTLEGGRTIEFGAMKDPSDWEKYKGRPHDLKAYDEVTEILELQFRATSGWVRTTIEGQRTRVVMAFNPPTNEDGMWVIRYFAPWLDDTHPNPAAPGELRWFAMVGGEEVEWPDGEPFEHIGPDGQPVLLDDGTVEIIRPQSRTFIPARLADNKYLMRTDYGRTLMALPEPLRSQLLHGDFKAGIGSDPWQVIPTAWVEASQRRWVALYDSGQGFGPLTCLGVDVAHGGKDKTALAPRRGNVIDNLLKYKGSETPDGMSAARFVAAAFEWGAEINVDLVGWGASCYERLIDNPPEGFGLPVNPINFASGSEHRDRSGRYKMINLRAEAYWRLREELDLENGTGLALPPDPELKSELCSARYEIRPNGIIIEPKDKIKERLGHSPDYADSVTLTCLTGAAATRVGGPVETKPAPKPDMRPQRPAWGIPGSLI